MLEARGKRNPSSAWAHHAPATILSTSMTEPPVAASSTKMRSTPKSLRKSTEEARRMLSASRRYSKVDATSAAGKVTSAGGLQYCNGCDAPLAKELGADQSMVGVFTRVSRIEYTLQILVRDTETGEVVSNAFTGLRMGANYAWPRGVKWLMNNRPLSAQRVE